MKNSKKPVLRVFEAFAGIGAQHEALKNANINFEVVGISDWYISAILAYDAIHTSNKKIKVPSEKAMLNYLNQFTFSADSVNPVKSLSKLKKEDLEKLYVANKRSKNYGSITEIKGGVLPDIDLLVYSFPCQDLSTGGKTLGMSKGSGTRSGLLWEVERILKELKEENRLPEYLLLENVKTIYADSNKKDLDEWLKFLESLGYCNGTKMVLNAVNFGIPQNRKRAFIISHLGTEIDDSSLVEYSKPANSILDFLKTDYKENPIHRAEADEAQLNRTPSRIEMWDINKREEIRNDTTINTITCNMDRSNTAAMFEYKGIKGKTFRLLTMREAFLLMGFTENDYEKVKALGFSYRKINKLIGNSIVVNVLTEIFKLLFKEKYGRK